MRPHRLGRLPDNREREKGIKIGERRKVGGDGGGKRGERRRRREEEKEKIS